MAPVVDVEAGKKAQDEDDEGPRAVLLEHGLAEEPPALAAVVDHGPEEPEDGARGAEGVGDADEIRENEAQGAAHREDHDEARMAEDLLDIGGHLANPEQVEDQMEEAAVQVNGGEDCPPAALAPRLRARHAEMLEGEAARGEEVEGATRAEEAAGVEEERCDVGCHGHDGDEPREVQAAHPASEAGGEAPQAGIPPPAVEAGGRVRAVELAAGVAEDRPRPLPEH